MTLYKNRGGIIHSLNGEDPLIKQKIKSGELFKLEIPKRIVIEEEEEEEEEEQEEEQELRYEEIGSPEESGKFESIEELRLRYEEKFGKPAHHMMKAETILSKLS